MSEFRDRLADRFIGSALGSFIGDAMGMAVEGWGPGAIRQGYGLLSDLMPGRFPAGSYTDDTEMMIGLLEILAERGRVDPAALAGRFLANFHPERGYGGRIYGIMDRLARGAAWDEVGTDSFGNGSAMRVAPVGFYFYDDLHALKAAAVAQAEITHRHPEALAGAVVQAGAVALALDAGLTGRAIDPELFVQQLAALAQDLDPGFSDRLLDLLKIAPGPMEDSISALRRHYRCDVRAIEAVPPAVGAFLLTADFSSAVILAVNLGGDTDTLGAMAGAVAGAYYGQAGLPESWVAVLENGPLGRDYVVDLCRQAAARKSAEQKA